MSFTGDKLAARFPNGVPDTIVFKDRLSDGHVYTDHISFQALKTPDRPGIHQRRIYWKSIPSANSGFPMVTPEDNIGEFTVEYSFNPEQTEATFKITKLSGEWSPNVQYMLHYRTKPTTANGTINPGLKYENAISLENTDFQQTVSTKYVQAAGATAQMTPGYGTFRIAKTLSGMAAGDVTPGTKVRFIVKYTLPDSWQPNYGVNWQAPENNPFNYEVEIGQSSTYFPNTLPFPAGTRIEITEDLNFAEPALPSHIAWDNPILTVNGEKDTTANFSIVAGQVVDVDAENGAVRRPSVSVGNYVWFDADKNGKQDEGEKGIDGVTLTISRTDGEEVVALDGGEYLTTTTTKDGGQYLFENLPVLPVGQKYVVTVTKPEGYEPTIANSPDAGVEADSSNEKETARDLPNNGDRDDTLDFGFYKPSVSVGNYVWFDADKNGKQDEGEPGIPNVTLNLLNLDGTPVKDADGNPIKTVTDSDGNYEFTDLPVPPAGKYVVTVEAPAGFEPTQPGVGDRELDSSTGQAESSTLAKDGDNDNTLDFGFVKKPEPIPNNPPIHSPHEPKGNDPKGKNPKSGKSLAKTGADTAQLSITALVLLGLGAAALKRRKRV